MLILRLKEKNLRLSIKYYLIRTQKNSELIVDFGNINLT